MVADRTEGSLAKSDDGTVHRREVATIPLRVSGNSGCMPGKPARAKGSSEAPPSAEPVRLPIERSSSVGKSNLAPWNPTQPTGSLTFRCPKVPHLPCASSGELTTRS